MFNDTANSANNQTVDDIFAETDKVSPSGAGDITTRKVGLASAEGPVPEETEKKGGLPWFKIAIVAIVAIIILLIGYLVYSQFFKNTNSSSQTPAVSSTSTTALTQKQNQNSTTTTTTTSSSTAETTNTSIATSTLSTSTELTTVPTSTIPEITATTTATSTVLDASSTLDSDSDGLTDYQEINVYHTDPYNPDTDGDGYLDGAEVSGGYNPNGAGRLSGLK